MSWLGKFGFDRAKKVTTGIGKTLKTQTLTTHYTYDNLGNLLKVVLPNNKVIEYIIDGQNHRVAKKINGAVNVGYLYNLSGQLVAELDASNRITKQLVYVSKSNSPDYLIYNAKNYRLVTDQVGTPTMIVDSTTGKVVTDYNYDEFGEQLSMRGKLDTSIGFAGGLYDKDTGLVRFGARDYDPETGRWTSKDPIGFGGGDTNLYGYVAEDPINHMDPSGTGPVTGGIVCAVLEGANGIYNAGNFIIDNNNLTNDYMSKIQKLKAGGGDTCPENEEQIAQLQVEFIHKQKDLVQSYMTPNLGRQALLGAACIATVLSPSP